MLSFSRLSAGLLSGVLAVSGWGLSFRQPGEPPVPPVSAEELAELDCKYCDAEAMVRGEKVLYLTFDAGYENGCTASILDTLAAHGAPAAFFVVGNYIQQNPELVQRMVREGHTVGNHTFHHPSLSTLTDEAAFRSELEALEALYEQTVGQPLPRYYRPPRGEYTADNLRQAQALGYRTVFWSLAYVDWEQDHQPDEQAALDKVLSRTHPGAVVLLHSTSTTNMKILDRLLTAWENEGYTLRPLPALFAEDPANGSLWDEFAVQQ